MLFEVVCVPPLYANFDFLLIDVEQSISSSTLCEVNGGGSGNRTREYRFCKPTPYHLAIPPLYYLLPRGFNPCEAERN